MFLLIAAFLAHLIYALLSFLGGAADWLSWLRYLAWIIQIPVLILAFMAAVMFAFACDGFFIRPILDSTAEGGEKYRVLVDNVRKRGVIVVPILIALVTLYVEVF